MSEKNNPIANPSVVLREEFDDWAILFDPDTGNAFGLNPTAAFVWKLLDGSHSVQDIVHRVRKHAQDVPEEAESHIDEFVSSLVKEGLVGYEVCECET
jgi:SynChlorMet cassette protein ScmD